MDCEPSHKRLKLSMFDLIPDKILIILFQYFNAIDLKTLRLVCKRFLNIFQDVSVAKRCPIVIENCYIHIELAPFSIFSKSWGIRAFPAIHIGTIDFDDGQLLKLFLTEIGKETRYLKIKYTIQNIRWDLLAFFPKLVELEVEEIEEILWYDPFPKTIERLIVSYISISLPFDIQKRIQELEHIKILNALKIIGCSKQDYHLSRFINICNGLVEILCETTKNWIKSPVNLLHESIEYRNVTALNAIYDLDDFEDCNPGNESVVTPYELEKFTGLRKLVLNLFDEPFCIGFHGENDFLRELEHFELAIDEPIEHYGSHEFCEDCFETILASKMAPHTVKIMVGMSSKQVKELLKTFPSIKKFALFVGYAVWELNLPYNEITMATLLQNLESLTLFNSDGECDETVLGILPDLPNLKVLRLEYIQTAQPILYDSSQIGAIFDDTFEYSTDETFCGSDDSMGYNQMIVKPFQLLIEESPYQHLAVACPNLETLINIGGPLDLRDIAAILLNLPKIKTINAGDAYMNFQYFCSMFRLQLIDIKSNLRTLKLGRSSLRMNEVAPFFQLMPNLRIVRGNELITLGNYQRYFIEHKSQPPVPSTSSGPLVKVTQGEVLWNTP